MGERGQRVGMDAVDFLNFDIAVERADAGEFLARAESPFGGAATRFRLPFSDLELENLSLRIGRGTTRFRALDTRDEDVVRDVGERLFEGVFAGDVGSCFQRTLDLADREHGKLRIRLKLTQVPELTNIPWEFLYSPRLGRFLSLSVNTQVVRYLEVEGQIRALRVAPPLRALVAMASPAAFPRLDVDHEWALLKGAVQHLESDGRLVMERLPRPTLSVLQETLRRGTYHMFHFIGHGGYRDGQGGVVLLEDEDGQGVVTRADRLATILHDERSLRLAILNSCEGARAGEDDVFSGTAQALVRAGIPAVIGMQNEISDQAAIIFAQQFYGAVADGYPVDQSVGEARKGMYVQQQDDTFEWSTPVLYMRATDGEIFDVVDAVTDEQKVAPTDPGQLAQQLPRIETPLAAPPPQPSDGGSRIDGELHSERTQAQEPVAPFCRRCGTPRTGDAAFCRRCGTRL